MRKLISLLLAAIMLAAALAGCAAAPAAPAAAKKGLADLPQNAEISPRITLTSSDAANAAEWLTARLEAIPDRVVLGTDADGYGVDVSALENDGYFIRALGDKVALLAKTATGLDRAVRVYAKAVEAGKAVADETYHEGYRIKRIELAGRDISDYTIYCEDEPYMLAAANEFAERIETACGARLAVLTDTPAAPYITMKYVHDEALGYVGYRWNVTADGLTLECSDGYIQESASVAVLRFLVDRLDWFGIDFGMEELPAADLITIGVGESGGETPDYDWVNPGALYGGDSMNRRFGLGPRTVADSGIETNGFGGDLSSDRNERGWAWISKQPCWTDEGFYEAAKEDIIEYIETRLEAGMEIGRDFFTVDIAQADNNRWCDCRDCMRILKAEGARSGVYLTWANRISAELEELYPGLIYEVFAYDDTKRPPKTIVPNDNLFLTFAWDHGCSCHRLDGTHCTTGDQWGANFDSLTLASWLRRWSELTDNLGIWYYASSDGLASMSVVHTVRDDVKFLRDTGVKALYWENKGNPCDTNAVSQWLAYQMCWNADLSEEQFDAYYGRMLRIRYGGAAEYVKYYITVSDQSYECSPCKNAWNGFTGQPATNGPFNRERLAETFDLTFALLEEAIPLADSAAQETLVTKLQCSDIFTGCLSAYPYAQAAHDEARMAELEARYALINERLLGYGIDISAGLPDYITKEYETELKAYFAG